MKVSYRAFATSPDEEIVISGIAGRFPKSANVAEFSDNLYNKVFKTDLSQNFIWIISEIPEVGAKTLSNLRSYYSFVLGVNSSEEKSKISLKNLNFIRDSVNQIKKWLSRQTFGP